VFDYSYPYIILHYFIKSDTIFEGFSPAFQFTLSIIYFMLITLRISVFPKTNLMCHMQTHMRTHAHTRTRARAHTHLAFTFLEVVFMDNGCASNMYMASLILRFAHSKRIMSPCLSVKVILSRDADRLLEGLEDSLEVVMLSNFPSSLIKSPVLPLLDRALAQLVDNS